MSKNCTHGVRERLEGYCRWNQLRDWFQFSSTSDHTRAMHRTASNLRSANCSSFINVVPFQIWVFFCKLVAHERRCSLPHRELCCRRRQCLDWHKATLWKAIVLRRAFTCSLNMLNDKARKGLPLEWPKFIKSPFQNSRESLCKREVAETAG